MVLAERARRKESGAGPMSSSRALCRCWRAPGRTRGDRPLGFPLELVWNKPLRLRAGENFLSG
jgi:hypothetical protein